MEAGCNVIVIMRKGNDHHPKTFDYAYQASNIVATEVSIVLFSTNLTISISSIITEMQIREHKSVPKEIMNFTINSKTTSMLGLTQPLFMFLKLFSSPIIKLFSINHSIRQKCTQHRNFGSGVSIKKMDLLPIG